MPNGRENSAFQGRVKQLLRDGYGTEDMAVMFGLDQDACDLEVMILRETGELAELYRK